MFLATPLLLRGTHLLANFAHWKSKDYKNFIFFVFPQIKFDQEYHKCMYDTVMLLRSSIFLLLTNGIDFDRLDKIHNDLLNSLKMITNIFDETVLKPNFHDFCHLVDNYKISGPLYKFSGFSFEHINGMLSRLSHGNKLLDHHPARNIQCLSELNDLDCANFDNFIYSKDKGWKMSKTINSNTFFCGKKSLLIMIYSI